MEEAPPEQSLNGADGADDPTFQSASIAVSSAFLHPEQLAEMIQSHKILHSGLDHNPKLCQGLPKITSAPSKQEMV